MKLAELFRRLIVAIYCLPPRTMVLMAVLGTLLFRFACRKYGERRWLRPGLVLGLCIWLGAVLWMTVLSRGGGSYEANWIPLQTYRDYLSGVNREALRSGAMNVALFYPAGLLLGGLMPRRWWALPLAVLLSGLFSLGLELSQFHLQLGFGEIDDVLHNTLGAAAGYLLGRLPAAD